MRNCLKVTAGVDYIYNICNMGGMGFIENNKGVHVVCFDKYKLIESLYFKQSTKIFFPGMCL